MYDGVTHTGSRTSATCTILHSPAFIWAQLRIEDALHHASLVHIEDITALYIHGYILVCKGGIYIGGAHYKFYSHSSWNIGGAHYKSFQLDQ